MITVADLRSQTVKDLSALARKMGLTGVHAMRKDQLVRALLRAQKAKSKTPPGAAARGKTLKSGHTGSRTGASSTTPSDAARSTRRHGNAERTRAAASSKSRNVRALRKIQKVNAKREHEKDLSHATSLAAKNGRKVRKRPKPRPTPVPGKDRVVLLVRDSYWLQACWDVTRQSVDRARAALAEHWHTCVPILRLMHVDAGATTSTTERIVREIPVHGGVKNWYIDIKDSPNSYRVELGYRADNGRFYALARSNTVTTPQPGSSDTIDENWTDIAANYEKIYAMSGGYEPLSAGGDLQELFEEQLRRPMGAPLTSRLGGGEQVLRRDKDFTFEVDAEMIIFGSTKAGAHVTLAGEPVKLRPDGTFTVRLSMPNRRQLLPVVASSRDGIEQRTIVLAVERNTKVMEPMIRDGHE